MFFKYEWTSVLHQSVTRIVTWIMDAGPARSVRRRLLWGRLWDRGWSREFPVLSRRLRLQKHLIKDCRLLEQILQANQLNDEQVGDFDFTQSLASAGERG
jgi:hypothetical protein